MITRDYDFIGFTYGDKHSIDDFGIYRISDGSRYNDNLVPQMTDKTADIPGGDGQYYFSTTYKNRQFSIPIAFDHLTENQYNQLRAWLRGNEIKDLIFDEIPYKVYSAKVTGTPSIKFICFEEKGERIYKGEGTVQFTCYHPFAHTPTLTKSGEDGRSLNSYSETDYPNKDEWYSNLPWQHQDGENYGDIPTTFKLETYMSLAKGDKLKVGELEVELLEDLPGGLIWDSKTGLIIGEVDGVERPIRTKGKTYGALPVGTTYIEDIMIDSLNYRGYKYFIDGSWEHLSGDIGVSDPLFTLEYNYWYY